MTSATNDSNNIELDISKNDNHLIITKISPILYLGPADHIINATEDFYNLGINVIINCAAEVRISEAVRNVCTVYDYHIVEGVDVTFLDYVDKATQTLCDCIRAKKRIYLTCVRGINRSPAIMIYYLMMYKHHTYDKALAMLKKLRPIISIHEDFELCMRSIDDNVE
jgi:protein-tyrosine phosphatase